MSLFGNSSYQFGSGLPPISFHFPTGGGKTTTAGNQGDGTVGTQSQTKSGSFIDLVGGLAGIARDIYVTKIQGELSENQVAAGQYPSTSIDARGNITPAFSANAAGLAGSTVWIIGGIILLVMLLRK